MDTLSYGGFYIEDEVGNNKFSYQERSLKKIYVPKLIEKDIAAVSIGFEVVFSEIDEGVEKKCLGLENMYKLKFDARYSSKEVYLFDNHNHAFFFWCKALKEKKFEKGIRLLHVDQHKDTRKPDNYDVNIDNLEDVSRYTNKVLNVGSFIQPALYHKIFDDVDIVDSTYGLEKKIPKKYVLDIDLDFFSKDMEYIDFDWRVERVKEYIDKADVITIATSPFFIEQDKAIEVLKILFDIEKTNKLW